MNTARATGYLVLVAAVLLSGGCRTISPPRGSVPRDRTMETTGYCKCSKCCGWKRTWSGPVTSRGARKRVGMTASGTMVRKGTIAADTSIYPFGTVMLVPGYGYGRVEDRGGAIKGSHIDLFFTSHGRALQWGRRTKKVRIWVPPGKKQRAA